MKNIIGVRLSIAQALYVHRGRRPRHSSPDLASRRAHLRRTSHVSRHLGEREQTRGLDDEELVRRAPQQLGALVGRVEHDLIRARARARVRVRLKLRVGVRVRVRDRVKVGLWLRLLQPRVQLPEGEGHAPLWPAPVWHAPRHAYRGGGEGGEAALGGRPLKARRLLEPSRAAWHVAAGGGELLGCDARGSAHSSDGRGVVRVEEPTDDGPRGPAQRRGGERGRLELIAVQHQVLDVVPALGLVVRRGLEKVALQREQPVCQHVLELRHESQRRYFRRETELLIDQLGPQTAQQHLQRLGRGSRRVGSWG
eukprot:scaffold59813_cov75-Phaeocystis_antarctica.AAC.2